MTNHDLPPEPEEAADTLVVAPASDEHGDGDNGGHYKSGPVKLVRLDATVTDGQEAEL